MQEPRKGLEMARLIVGRKRFFVGAVIVALAVALTVGLAVARSQEGAALPELAPAELLAKVAQEAPKSDVVNGDVAWTNELLGAASLLVPGGEGGLGSLLQSGSGRFWYQEGKFRFESQGPRGDMVAVVNGQSAWVYSSESGTATEYALPAISSGGGDGEGATGDPIGAVDLPQKIQSIVDMLAPDATLTVTTDTVAGRDSYVLTMTPTATNTVVGSVQAAFDGTTFLPLRVQVFAKGDAQPVLEAGFTKVSYDRASDDMFAFTPPADATVEHSTLAAPGGMLEKVTGAVGHTSEEGAVEGDPAARELAKQHAELTLDEAVARAGFGLAVPSDPPLAFQGAMVIDARDVPDATGAPDALGSAAVLRYGEGFGTVVVIETKIADAQWTQATAALAQVPLLGTPSAFGGHQVYQLSTKLGSLVAWRQGDVVVLLGGSVSRADLETFAASISE